MTGIGWTRPGSRTRDLPCSDRSRRPRFAADVLEGAPTVALGAATEPVTGAVVAGRADEGSVAAREGLQPGDYMIYASILPDEKSVKIVWAKAGGEIKKAGTAVGLEVLQSYSGG